MGEKNKEYYTALKLDLIFPQLPAPVFQHYVRFLLIKACVPHITGDGVGEGFTVIHFS